MFDIVIQNRKWKPLIWLAFYQVAMTLMPTNTLLPKYQEGYGKVVMVV